MKRLMMAAAATAVLSACVGVLPAKAADVKLWRLDCGTIQVNNLDLFSDTFAYAGQKRQLTDSCYLIQHGADYMVWDTGLPAGLLNAPMKDDAPLSPTLTVTLADQLAKLAVKADAVKIVGIS